jgi:hypothetical protein
MSWSITVLSIISGKRCADATARVTYFKFFSRIFHCSHHLFFSFMITSNTLQRVEILIRMQRTITENVIGRSFSLRDYARQLECQCNKQSWTLKKKTISILMTTTPERSSLFISLSQRQDDTPERQRCHEFGSLDQTFPRASHRSSIRTECVVDSLG